MTIDQLNEIKEWLSPLDDYGMFSTQLESIHKGTARAEIRIDGRTHPGQIQYLYFSLQDKRLSIENTAETQTPIEYTSVWEQICLRVL